MPAFSQAIPNEKLMGASRLANNPTFLTVVAAAIPDQRDRLLLQRRPMHKHHGGMWEFPGGKVESAENPRFSLQREIAEELDLRLEISTMRPAGFADQVADSISPALVLILYICPDWQGVPSGMEQQEWGWFTRVEAAQLDLAPMDRLLLSGLAPQ
jgi:8-oxo-dGTP diphosphatase